MRKVSVLLIEGGRSGEHEVSKASADSIAQALDSSRYDLVRVTIGRDGVWRNELGEIRILSPVPKINHLLNAAGQTAEPVDVVFPIIHGTFGEDGCLQGLLELAELPYVGSGVLGSSIGMDKVQQKRVLRDAGIPVVDHICFRNQDWMTRSTDIITEIETQLGYANFVKPVNMGSSVGITKAHNVEQLANGIETALKYDSKIIIERAVSNPREIECAVLGGDIPRASVLGEIKAGNDFYDYEAKYESSTTELIIPADLSGDMAKKLRQLAVRVFEVLEAEGLSRVDFLIDANTDEITVNEINTLPGFTQFSMYPKLWEATGISYNELLDKLISIALAKAKSKMSLVRGRAT